MTSNYVLQPIAVGTADFRRIRARNAVYVDKTEMIHSFVCEEGAKFISRPRKFGKSLMLSTVAEMLGTASYEAKMKLFEGLWVAENEEGKALLKQQQHEVLHFDFATLDAFSFEKDLQDLIESLGALLEIQMHKQDSVARKVDKLLTGMAERSPSKRVVVLIDEVFNCIASFYSSFILSFND